MTPDLRDARWRKSSRSQNGGNCIEVAATETAVAVRDSKDTAGPILTVAPAAWTIFTEALHRDTLA